MPLYNRGMQEILGTGTDWATSNIDLLLVDETYTFDRDDNFVSDISGEISTTNYARQSMASLTQTENDTDDRVDFDADDVTFTALGPATGGPTVGGAVIFRNVADTDATSPVLAFVDLVNTQVNGSDFTIQWNANGVFNATSP